MARVQIHCLGGHCLNKSEMQHGRENPELVETVRVLAGATASALVECCQRFGRRRTPAGLEAWEKRLDRGPRPRPGQTERGGRAHPMLLPRHAVELALVDRIWRLVWMWFSMWPLSSGPCPVWDDSSKDQRPLTGGCYRMWISHPTGCPPPSCSIWGPAGDKIG